MAGASRVAPGEQHGSQQAPKSIADTDDSVQENKDDEEPECGFCVWMKAGGCKEQFEVWQKCVDDSKAKGEAYEEVCQDYTTAMFVCMQQHSDYYFKEDGDDEDDAPAPQNNTTGDDPQTAEQTASFPAAQTGEEQRQDGASIRQTTVDTSLTQPSPQGM